MAEINQNMAHLMKAVYRRGWRGSEEARKKISETLARAVKDIEEALT